MLTTFNGFTLIELLISLGILSLLLTGVLGNYRTFNTKQELQQSAKNLQEDLRFAQKKARVGEKPAGCNSPNRLEGYVVAGDATGRTYQISARCTNGDFQVVATGLEGDTYFALSADLEIVYKVLAGGVENPETILMKNGTFCYEFDVLHGGEISEGDYVTCP